MVKTPLLFFFFQRPIYNHSKSPKLISWSTTSEPVMVLDTVHLKISNKNFRKLWPVLLTIATNCPHIQELDISFRVIHFDKFFKDLAKIGRMWSNMKKANIARSNVNPLKFINCFPTLEELTVDERYEDDALFQFLIRNVNSDRNTKVQIFFI